MNDPRAAEATALRLAELSHEIDELESSRAALLKRVDALRTTLLLAGNRTTTNPDVESDRDSHRKAA